MLTKGDKIVLTKEMGMFKNVGEICNVLDVTDSGTITFSFGNGMHMGCMSSDEFEKYFVKYEEPKKNTVTDERIEKVLNHSKVIVETVFDKCTIVACQLPNGFVIVESSACVDPKNYNEEVGVEQCMNRIVDKVWELEGYNLQTELNGNSFAVDDLCEDCDEDCKCHGSFDCEECPYDDEDEVCIDCDDCPDRHTCLDYDGFK